MLQYKLETLEGLEEKFHEMYEQKDGAYFLKVSGVVPEEEVNGLKKSRDELLSEKKEQQRKAEEAEQERLRVEREAQEELARKNGDFESLQKSWKERHELEKQELMERLKQKDQIIYTKTVKETAAQIAGRNFKSHAQPLAMDYIERHLRLNENGEVEVTDGSGNLVALSVAEFEHNLKTLPMFQDIVIVNTNSGGGAAGSGFGGGAAKKPNEYTVQEMKELRASNPELYNQLFPLK